MEKNTLENKIRNMSTFKKIIKMKRKNTTMKNIIVERTRNVENRKIQPTYNSYS